MPRCVPVRCTFGNRADTSDGPLFRFGLVGSGSRSSCDTQARRIAGTSPPPSFLNELLPLITRLGCNQGSCHGKNDGRNGFKLSAAGLCGRNGTMNGLHENLAAAGSTSLIRNRA